MATVVHEHLDVIPVSGFKISWGGIWAGMLTVLGTLLVLTTLGVAVGVSAVNPGQTQAGTFGTGAAIWSGISLLIALFVGGMAATRLGMVFDRAAGAFEGALVWVLSMLVVLWLASSGVQLLASGISSLFGGIGQTVGASLSNMENLSTGDVQQILNRLNDPQTAQTIAAATGMSEQEVRAQLSDVSRRVEAVRDNPQQAAAQVRQGTAQLMDRARAQLPAMAERAQAGATKAAWITFVALIVSLAAAIAGAMLGRKRVVNALAHSDVPSEIFAGQERSGDRVRPETGRPLR
ncbi:hypothetical protein [Steroidobacter cummioxidans]|uniref:hypothetical protein n=1 Tax=Steroidobacter cummioxidans TaxID=1803913 RepID=UPI000E320D5D|nr:hypothetical protein [Steroidobacter cummioxidans]